MNVDLPEKSARVIAGDAPPGEFGSIGLNEAPELHVLDDDIAFVAAFSNVAAFTAPRRASGHWVVRDEDCC